MKQTIKSQETNWMNDYGVFALNRDSRMFEKLSNVEGSTIELHKDKDENAVSNIIADRYAGIDADGGFDIDYTLYNFRRELVGFVYRTE